MDEQQERKRKEFKQKQESNIQMAADATNDYASDDFEQAEQYNLPDNIDIVDKKKNPFRA